MVQSKSDKERQKIINDKCQSIIEKLLKSEDNKYCVDCDAKGPRWASWNLGIFMCIRCAGIHRNLGVHISKVKSVNLDSWSPEHVAYVQRMGNSKSRAIYEANLPDDFRRPQTDATLESFIRAKYEQRKYIASDWTDPGPPAPAFNAEEELKRAKEQKRNKSTSKTKNLSSSSGLTLPTSSIPATNSTNSTPRPTDMSNLKDKTKNTPGLFDMKTVAAAVELAPKSVSAYASAQTIKTQPIAHHESLFMSNSSPTTQESTNITGTTTTPSNNNSTNKTTATTSYVDLLSDSFGTGPSVSTDSSCLIDVKPATADSFMFGASNDGSKDIEISDNIFSLEPSINPSKQEESKQNKVMSKEAILSLYSFSNYAAANSDPFGMIKSSSPVNIQQATKQVQPSQAASQLSFGLSGLNLGSNNNNFGANK